MKKLLSLVLTLTIVLGVFSMTACGDDTQIKVGVMSGPTGMGMAKLMHDNAASSEKYAFSVYTSPEVATGDLTAGKLDVLCLPTNVAANLANKSEDFISVCAINTLGSLYLLTDSSTTVNSIKDLEGKTIYASVPTSTTGPIINFLLEQNGVNATVEFVPDHPTLVGLVKKNSASIAVLPEPMVTKALAQNSAYSVDLNLSREWDKVSTLPLAMGCIVARNDFIKEHKSVLDKFLKKYSESINYISTRSNLDSSAEMIVEAGIIDTVPNAKNALSNLFGSIVYIDGSAMKEALIGFYQAIEFAKLPSDEFYYEK